MEHVLSNVNKISINNDSVILSQWAHWWKTVLLCFVEIFRGIDGRFFIESTETFHGINGIFT